MITPQDAAKENDRIHADELAAAEKAVDRALAQSFSTGRPVTIAGSTIKLDYHLRKKLIERYERAGWEVKHHSDQRDGDYYEFSARPTGGIAYLDR